MTNVDAQWYYAQYGVTNMNELNQKQLNVALEQSLKTINTGQILTGVGVGITLIGTIIYASGLKDIVEDTYTSGYTQIEQGLSKTAAGGLILAGGSTLLSTGIIVWIIGDSRMKVVKVHLAKYDQVYIPSIGLKLTF